MERAAGERSVVEELRRQLALGMAEREELRAKVQRLVERFGDEGGEPEVMYRCHSLGLLEYWLK